MAAGVVLGSWGARLGGGIGETQAAGTSGPNNYGAKMGEVCRGFTVAVLAVGLVSGEIC